MGVRFSCPLGDLDAQLQAALLQSVSPRQQQETTKPPCSRRLVMEVETKHVIGPDREDQVLVKPFSPILVDGDRELDESDIYLHACSEPGNTMHHAVLKLQKVYRSFRTRRQLADCAVLAEQRWWKLLDFAELKRSSISFFDIGKPETAHSRWFRARKRAAKVGKGLSKDEKARKLALQHWLEAIDPRHRYGHNLQFYYAKWLHCQSREPFFYWLDIGEGKEMNLERCCRSKLQQQCIKYLGPTEREDYEVVVKDGRFFYKQSGKLLDTSEDKEAKWIFVLSVSRNLYVGKKSRGTFQHSSFLAGGATLSAGRLVVEDGVLKAVWPHSGHYLPTEENFLALMSYLTEHCVDLTDVQKSPSEDDEQIIVRMSSSRSERSEAEALPEIEEAICAESTAPANVDPRKQDSDNAGNASPKISRLSRGLLTNVSKLKIPTRHDMVEIFKPANSPKNCQAGDPEIPGQDGYDTAEEVLPEEEFMFPKPNLFGDDGEEGDKESILKEKIMKRIDSHNKHKSYQLAQQLSSRWSTGAGPRISCMRDYPLELQNQVLEQNHLSPRTSGSTAIRFPWRTSQYGQMVMSPTVLFIETGGARSPLAPPGALPRPATP